MKWKQKSTKEVFSAGFYRLREDVCELPDGRVMPNYYVLEFADWVNVLPITKDRKVILIKQYRHAAGDEFIEIPGGSMDPGSKETPQQAAARELLEETGYKAAEWADAGSHYPNPALQNNQMHTFLAMDCEKVSEQNLDPYEDIQVVEVPIDEFGEMVKQGKIKHSLILASIYKALALLAE